MAIIELVRSSVLDVEADAIVNAASKGMRGGGGLDGAVHAAAGPEMMAALRAAAPRGASTGEAVVTPGYDLRQKWIIHVAGPAWGGGGLGENEALDAAYRNSVHSAMRLGVRVLALPSLSTGIYAFPIARAAPIAIRAVRETAAHPLERAVFALYNAREFQAFSSAWRQEMGEERLELSRLLDTGT